MKTLTVLALMSTLATAALAADIGFTKDDNPATLLTRHTGKKVELRLRSGDKISGTVKAVGVTSVHISAVIGQEFFDAVISLEDISAVLMRNDGK